MKCPVCQREPEQEYYGELLTRIDLPKGIPLVDGYLCKKCGNFVVLNDGSIYKLTWSGWEFFKLLKMDPKFIGGFKVIQ
jgi:hypothetical protein